MIRRRRRMSLRAILTEPADDILALATATAEPRTPAPKPPVPADEHARHCEPLTPDELAYLAGIAAHHAGDPRLARNGALTADAFRRALPHVADTDLGRLAVSVLMCGRQALLDADCVECAMTVLLDAVAAAALDLTALDREDAPR